MSIVTHHILFYNMRNSSQGAVLSEEPVPPVKFHVQLMPPSLECTSAGALLTSRAADRVKYVNDMAVRAVQESACYQYSQVMSSSNKADSSSRVNSLDLRYRTSRISANLVCNVLGV